MRPPLSERETDLGPVWLALRYYVSGLPGRDDPGHVCFRRVLIYRRELPCSIVLFRLAVQQPACASISSLFLGVYLAESGGIHYV